MAQEKYVRLLARGYWAWAKYLMDFDEMKEKGGRVRREVSDKLFEALMCELYKIVMPFIKVEKEVAEKAKKIKGGRKKGRGEKDKEGGVKVTHKKGLGKIKA